MHWYDNAVFYHIYPLGLTGAPKRNDYGEAAHRLDALLPWVDHMAALGCSALYIGPLFQSGSHGYDTTDYRTVDCRLGTNDDLRRLVAACHGRGIRVVLDGVFNHVGRDFFAFQDLKERREQSPYRDWFCNVNFYGNNEYGDGFSYDNWGGYNLLVKLNQRNGQVQRYLCDAIRGWVADFDIDGLRLDAADVLDFGFMQVLRRLADEVKPDFWLMGEVIHGDYTRWVNGGMLHSVTDYALHKALYSGHNDHNYFEIAHTVKRLRDMGLNRPGGAKLYSFADNHDVDRIASKLQNQADLLPVYVLLYTLPGIPSVYYGSEFGLEGRKQRGSDDELRPAIDLNDYADAALWNPWTGLIAALGRLRR
ncbi:MAG: alpha-amylase, partial [Oscillospiraceae bacterium]|nr:alpha-amylase [Oscillospiraceae bacterium]